MWIPTEAVGKVIGKKGAVITHIQLTTQTEVVVLTITEGSEHWSPVVITGEPFKALQAYELIKDIAEETDDIVLEFPLPRQKIYHGLFYGNHHDAVKYLSADTNVRINIPEAHGHPNSHQISLEGAAENVFRALMKFAEVLSNPDHSSSKALTSNAPLKLRMSTDDCLSPLVEKEGYFEQTAKIPSHIVGLLLVRRTVDPNVIHLMRQLTATTILKVESEDGAEDNLTDIADLSEEKHPASLTAKFNPRGYEIFSIRGVKESDVTLASSCLSRIVEGEKIFLVMNELKSLKGGSQYRPEDFKRDPVDVFPGRGRGGRTVRGRGFFGASRGESPFSRHHVRATAETSDALSANEDGASSHLDKDGEVNSRDDKAEALGQEPAAGDEEGREIDDDRGRGEYGGRGDRRGRGRGMTGRSSRGGRLRYERGRGPGAARGRGRIVEE